MKKIYMSMVTPGKCNLNCWFCGIKERGEDDKIKLTPDDYKYFLKDTLASNIEVERFSLQGHEPFLDESWELTCELLKIADSYNVPGISVVTNGTLIDKQKAEEISTICDELVVSLDSGKSDVHDKMRRTKGAFEKTLDGLRKATGHFGDALMVNSVLIPGKRQYLESVPAVISSLGITHWFVTPLADFSLGKYAEENIFQLGKDIEILSIIAKKYNVSCHLSDDMGIFDLPEIRTSISIAKPEKDIHVIRLSPNGRCSLDKEVIRESKFSQSWPKEEKPSSFIEKIINQIE